MRNFLSNLKASDIIQIVAIVCSTITSIVSIIISVRALKETSKSINDANRPYVVFYYDFIQMGSSRINYLIIKNFGKSSAVIDKVTYSNLEFFEHKVIPLPFKNLHKCSIAPKQSFSTAIKFKKDYVPFSVTIDYHTTTNKFTETFNFNLNALANQIVSITNNSNQSELEKTITMAAQEICRQNL